MPKLKGRQRKDNDEMFVFKVFIPNNEQGRELKNKIISYSKLYCKNKVWKCLNSAMNVLIETEEKMKTSFLDRLNRIENKLNQIEKGHEKPATFGSRGKEDKNDRKV